MNIGFVAWNQLLSKLKHTKQIPLSQLGLEDLPSKAALFVTWNYDGDLRGCIGTFSPGPLESTLRSYSEIAAFEDPRFDPITVDELPHLSVAVTLLGEMEPCSDDEDWIIGQHGVRAEFSGGYSATFLPEVAEEQGWDHQETLMQLARKAGARSLKGLKLWRYAGHKSKLTYKEYNSLAENL